MTAPAPHEWQLACADAFVRCGGVVVDREPGAGKTYAAALIARRCARPLVVAPASVIPQTMAMFRSYGVGCYLAKDDPDMLASGTVAFASYTWLTRAEQHDFLTRYRPSDVLMDEFHKARGLRNSARVRLERYLMANPAARVGVFSASLITDRVTDYGPAFTWALRGRVRDLVPATRAGLESLQARFDESPDQYAAFLEKLSARDGVFRDGDGIGRYTGRVVVRVIRREPALTLPADWSLPDGYFLTSPSQAAEAARLLAWGAWMRVTPRPSETYLAERRHWAHVVRSVIATGAADTEFQVRALRPEAWLEWAEAEAAEPEASEEVVWAAPLSMPPIRAGIVWADRRCLQDGAAVRLACPLHRELGYDADGVRLDETRAPLVVASIEACHQGMNAQAFNHSLVLEPPSDPEVWRQLIGRTARQGQTSPVVTVDIVINCRESESALRTAIARAKVSGKPNSILQLDGTDW